MFPCNIVWCQVFWSLQLCSSFSNLLWLTAWNFLRKLKMELPFDPAIPLLGLYPKSPETPIQKNLYTPMFIAAQFTTAKCWKQRKCPSVNEWIKKRWYIYTKEYYAAERKKGLLTTHAFTRNQTDDLSVGRPVFNPLSHTSQGYTEIFLKAQCILHNIHNTNSWWWQYASE